MIDMNEMMSRLLRSRPIFHSEADFQHALAWEIHKQYLNCSIRLEIKPPYLKERIYLDIWCAHGDGIIAIELKYKTRGLIVNVNKETFGLLDQSAQDIGRYDFIKDMQRHGRILTGELSWAPGASEGTMRGREDKLYVKGAYNLNWKDYSEINQKSYGRFRYLLVKVESGPKE